jgi:hypothetical protein
MKKVLFVLFLVSKFAFAGGVMCKECPAESDACAPRPNCHQNLIATDSLSLNCAPYFKLITCKENCAYSAGQLNAAISPTCVESCMQQPCQ